MDTLGVEIKGFIRNTFIDWEGEIASIIFFPGCNFRCPFCHAPHLVLNGKKLASIPFGEVRNFLVASLGWIDGVVISGGEPTLQPGLVSIVQTFKEMGLKVKLDTNGSNPESLKFLLRSRLLDFVAMDLKAPLDERYRRAAGVDCEIEKIEQSVDLLLEGDVDYEFRTTVVPTILSRDDLQEMAIRIRGAKRFILQEFKGGDCLDPRYNDIPSYSRRELAGFARELAPYLRSCFVRGSN